MGGDLHWGSYFKEEETLRHLILIKIVSDKQHKLVSRSVYIVRIAILLFSNTQAADEQPRRLVIV